MLARTTPVREERAAKRREFDAKAPKLRARLETVVGKAINTWKSIDASLREIDELLTELEDPEMRNPHFAGKIYERLREATDGAVTYNVVGWTISWIVRR